MLYWIRYPFIRIAISFAGGILVNYYTKISAIFLLAPLMGCLVVFYISKRYFSKDQLHKFNLCISFSAFSALFLLGCLSIQTRDISYFESELTNKDSYIDYYLTRIIDAPDTSGRYCKVLSRVSRIRSDGKWHKISAKVLLFLPKNEVQSYGNTLLVSGRPKKILPPKNPDEFDYRKYMHIKGISHQHFLKSGRFIEIDRDINRFSLKGLSLGIRDNIACILDKTIKDRNTRAIMLALITGQRNYIDEDSYNSFIETGIIHVLAISGLHVGIIYMFLIYLLKPLSRNKWSRTFSYCLKISILIVFAFMTGLSPSVMRATLMFIIMIIGKILNRNSHILNSVFSSFFLLLVFDPFKLFDVGFQLSYSAVTGIILFQPLIYQGFKFRLKITDWAWQLITVSIAAQLGTLPFSIYYFKQFPTYFLLGNIFAIPFVTVVTVLGFTLIFTSFIPNICSVIVIILESLSSLFIKLISVIKSLPFGLIKPLQVDAFQGLMMIVLILNIFFMLRTRNWRLILISLVCAFGIIVIDLKEKVISFQEKYLIVYNIPNISCIELVSGNTSIIVLRNLHEVDIDKINYHVMGHIIKKKRKTKFTDYSGLSEKIPAKYQDGNLLVYWNGKSIAMLGESESTGGLMENSDFINLNIDYLVISNSYQNIEGLLSIANRKENIIFDSSNSYKLLISGREHKYESIYYVLANGPYIKQINNGKW
jgi:competence protein ComEC